MIPCYICGKDIGGGWSIGFPPAPDSEKMGLCREHDLASHRQRVQKSWQDLIYKRLQENTQNIALRAGDVPQLLSIYFTGGGAVSLPCSSFTVIDGKTLKVITPVGEHIYFPLNQVRNYALSPLEAKAQQAAPRRAQNADAPDAQEAQGLEAAPPAALPVTEPLAGLPPALKQDAEAAEDATENAPEGAENTAENAAEKIVLPPADEQPKIIASMLNENGGD